MLIKYACFGFKYYPVLDDFVQYGLYPNIENVWQNVLAGGAKTIYARPLAGIFDIFVWGRMWDFLGLALIIITILHAASGILFYKTMSRMRFSVSPLFLVVYGFLPIGSEGTYWLSASSRVVVSMFFVSCSVWFLVKSINDERKRDLLFYFVFSAASCCFYEPTLVLSLFLSVYIIFFYSDYKKLPYPILIFILVAAYYFVFGPMGDNGSRIAVIKLSELSQQFSVVMEEFKLLWGRAHILFYTNGIPRSLNLIAENRAWLWSVLVLGGCILWVKQTVSLRKNYSNTALGIFQIITGVLLALIPYVPFVISKNNMLNFRTAFPSFVGIALAVDSLLQMGIRNKKTLAVLTSVVLVVFMIVNYSEVHDYNKTGQADMRLAQEIAKQINETGENELVYYNDHESNPYLEQNSPLREHVQSVTSLNNWSLTGAVRAYSNNHSIRVLPVIR